VLFDGNSQLRPGIDRGFFVRKVVAPLHASERRSRHLKMLLYKKGSTTDTNAIAMAAKNTISSFMLALLSDSGYFPVACQRRIQDRATACALEFSSRCSLAMPKREALKAHWIGAERAARMWRIEIHSLKLGQGRLTKG
jgi:hypothetical protein